MSARRHAPGVEGPGAPGFLHDDPEFPQLLRIVREQVPLDVEFVEKDYWVTHVLWWLQREGFTVCFKGGTSLSKGFGLIQRFSEDIDLYLVAPSSLALPPVAGWDPKDTTHATARLTYFRALGTALARIPGIAGVRYAEERHAERHVNALYFLDYRPHFADAEQQLSPTVQLELAPDPIHARLARPIRSFVHDNLPSSSAAAYAVNRPGDLMCMHPIATLLGKLDAICNQHRRKTEPTKYIRHFEDAHHIITAIATLPPLPDGLSVHTLTTQMRADGQIRRAYDDDAFALADPTDREQLERAHAALARWHWGPRVPLMEACATIRRWLADEVPFAES